MLNKKRSGSENRFAYLVNTPMIIYLGCVLAGIPIIIIYMIASSGLVGGAAEGGVKGSFIFRRKHL